MLQSPASKLDDYSIQGASATKIEWYVALALDKLEIPYLFQYELAGGRTFRGGMILDFLALTSPLSTPIDVRGSYWHQPQQRVEDDLQLALMNHYGKGQFALPVIVYDSELQSPEMAFSTIKRELRV